MKRLPLLLVALIFSTAYVSKNSQHETFSRLLLLEGTWQTLSKNGKVIGEQWKKINDSLLQGTGFFVNEQDTIISENTTLRQTANAIIYSSTVSDQNYKNPVLFTLTTVSENEFTFENAGHDFPKRIVYKFITPDSIHAYIDAGKSDATKRKNFFYKKVK